MLDADRKSLSEYRIEKAIQCLATAENAISIGDYAAGVNRSYYAIFHAIRAVFALQGIDFKKHSAVIAKFRELYIKTGIFPIEFSDMVGSAFELRNDCDYEDFYVVEKDEMVEQITHAKQFVQAVKDYLA